MLINEGALAVPRERSRDEVRAHSLPCRYARFFCQGQDAHLAECAVDVAFHVQGLGVLGSPCRRVPAIISHLAMKHALAAWTGLLFLQ